MIDRLFINGSRLLRLGKDVLPGVGKVMDKGLKALGRIGGNGLRYGAEGGLNFFEKVSTKAVEIGEKGTVKKLANNVGKFSGHLVNDVETTFRGANNVAGILTNGYEAKGFNAARNKLFNTNKYTGRRIAQVLKDSDESVLLGKRATKFGVAIIATGGAIMSTKDAVVDRLHAQQGRVVGSAGNAPVNNYAYQGASYADNAGATGDLVLSMHRQRHNGIL